MEEKGGKRKLTISIDSKLLENVRAVSSQRCLNISRLVSGFLEFLCRPNVYCFVCGSELVLTEADLCEDCGWVICKCGACACKLKAAEAKVASFNMRKVYERLLGTSYALLARRVRAKAK